MKILVLNSGSSSIKFQLFDMEKEVALASGLVEQIGEKIGKIKVETKSDTIKEELVIANHEQGLKEIQARLKSMGVLESLDAVDGIGHRVVQGGDMFTDPTLINDEVVKAIDELAALAPLHNPANLAGIKTVTNQAPSVPQVAVFDTAFHQSMPPHAYMYALPYEMYEEYKIRRYGFHGTSHGYVAKEAAKYLGIDFDKFNAVVLHLGNGASASAVKNGKSIDTSMGLTPLEGLIMGTRCGDMDPSIVEYITQKTGKSISEVNTLLNKQSGLKGICGDNDARVLEGLVEKKDPKGLLAFNMMAYRIKKYIGAYIAAIGKIDAIIFTGGIGENYAELRSEVCNSLGHLGIGINDEVNFSRPKGLSDMSDSSKSIKVLRIPTNEELEIAFQTKQVIMNK